MVRAEDIMTDEPNKRVEDARTTDSLSEVLRLQAEALARMSERLGRRPDEAAVPPPRPGGEDGGHLPMLANDPSLSEESLPVLNTFKKFLDAERRRARRRVVWVSLVFGIGFMAVLGVVAWVGRERIRDLRKALGAANERMEANQRQTEEDLAKANRIATVHASTVQQDLRRGLLASHQVLASNMTVQLEGRNAEVEQLKEKLSSLEIENALLIGQLKELAETTKRLQENLAGGLVGSPAAEAVPAEEPTNRPPPVLINSPGYGRPVQLRIPMSP
jgi:hypothetical protein